MTVSDKREAQAPEGDVAAVLGRLRANLAAARISATDEDVEVLFEHWYFEVILSFERIADAVESAAFPDYAYREFADSLPQPEVDRLDAHISDLERGGSRGVYPSRGNENSISGVARRIAAREVSPVELTKRALERIAERDPDLNAFQLVLPEQALAAARRAEDEIGSGGYRGPLHGVPVAVKDLLAMAGTDTTAGSVVLRDWYPDEDARSVELLRAAGAVIVGKTRLSEFAYSPGSNNAHYGPTRNPWNPLHDTGGSSSGSAAAVADGMVYAALGTDTGGSIRIPAALCGIVGLKPTFGRVSLHGGVPLSWSLDHLGPITRTVEDAALLLAVLSGPDARDPRTLGSRPFDAHNDLHRGVEGMRVGVLREDGSGRDLGTSDALRGWRDGLAALENAGAQLVELDVPEIDGLRTMSGVILGIEASSYHHTRLRDERELLGEFLRSRLLSAYAHSPQAYVRAQQARSVLRRRVAGALDGVDLLSTPSMPYGAPLLGQPASTAFTAPFNCLGWPAITVPAGLTEDGLPVGLQLVGRPWDEAKCLRAAVVVEAAGLLSAPPVR